MADLREDFVRYVVKALVANPDAVELERKTDEKGEYLELTVDPPDMGKVIGKAGATAKSLRTLLRGVGSREDLAPLPLKIVDPQDHKPVAVADPAVADDQAPVEADAAPAAEEAAPEVDEDEERRRRTKQEMDELADLEL